MIVTAIQCEACEHTTVLPRDINELPVGWLIARKSYEEPWHFCSLDCLKTHFGVVSEPVQESPASKMRRFLLVSENADITEGVKWSNGCVSLDPKQGKTNDMWFYRSWEELKEAHPGYGVQWIDQEVDNAR